MTLCEYVTCHAEAEHRVVYSEPGVPRHTVKLCGDHKKAEEIDTADPFHTRADPLV